MPLKLARVSPPHHPTLDPVPLPAYKSSGAAGMDLYADVGSEGVEIPPGWVVAIPTGLKMEIPEGYEGQIRPRSGLAFKDSVTVINSPGTVDADYRGEVLVGLVNHHSVRPFHVHRGDRIAQLALCLVATMPIVVVEESELSSTVRGEGGIGSTGVSDSKTGR